MINILHTFELIPLCCTCVDCGPRYKSKEKTGHISFFYWQLILLYQLWLFHTIFVYYKPINISCDPNCLIFLYVETYKQLYCPPFTLLSTNNLFFYYYIFMCFFSYVFSMQTDTTQINTRKTSWDTDLVMCLPSV